MVFGGDALPRSWTASGISVSGFPSLSAALHSLTGREPSTRDEPGAKGAEPEPLPVSSCLPEQQLDDLEDILSEPQRCARPFGPDPFESPEVVLLLADRPWEELEREEWLNSLKKRGLDLGLSGTIGTVVGAATGAAAGAVLMGPGGLVFGAMQGAKGGAALAFAGAAVTGATKEVTSAGGCKRGAEAQPAGPAELFSSPGRSDYSCDREDPHAVVAAAEAPASPDCASAAGVQQALLTRLLSPLMASKTGPAAAEAAAAKNGEKELAELVPAADTDEAPAAPARGVPEGSKLRRVWLPLAFPSSQGPADGGGGSETLIAQALHKLLPFFGSSTPEQKEGAVGAREPGAPGDEQRRGEERIAERLKLGMFARGPVGQAVVRAAVDALLEELVAELDEPLSP